MSYIETMAYNQLAKIAAENRRPFRSYRGLAAPHIFLDTMLNRRTEETCPIDCT
jgi:hypothetical protein